MTKSLTEKVFRDKVFGCWMGKNCGGTLGTPLETSFGKEEPFDVWWYPRLEKDGIPNDDLELQLIWLLALEEVGPGLDASDLLQYWLDYVGYNWDEYGLHRTNLKMGLLPPVSSVHNNWFKDCMGCPIRSEIWACVAPGYPRIAVKYAYEDAIIDHAGGEGLYGELFNTAIQASAFVLDDPATLLDIGLSYVPEHSQTYAAVTAAMKAHKAGVDWKEARRRVMKATPHYNTQHAPLNMGFQVIGWLYGNDFGDAICKAVNCGYDTDCTGATLGSYIGIVDGNSKLPKKWMEPLGTVIATNASWGGLRNVDKGRRPIPKDTVELTDRTLVVAAQVLRHHGVSLESIPCDVASLKADAASLDLLKRNPWQINHSAKTVNIGVEYPKSATIAPGQTRKMVTHLENPHPCPVEIEVALEGTDAVKVTTKSQSLKLPPFSTTPVSWKVTANGTLQVSNRLNLVLSAKDRPALPTFPIILLAANRWRLQGPLPSGGQSDRELFDAVFKPEKAKGALTSKKARDGKWIEVTSEANAIPFPKPFTKAGVLYAQTFSWSPEVKEARIGIPTNVPVKIWVNGILVSEVFTYRPYRPNYAGCYDDKPNPYEPVKLKKGWNEILVKFVRRDGPLEPSSFPFEAGLILTNPKDQQAGLTDQLRAYFPWQLKE